MDMNSHKHIPGELTTSSMNKSKIETNKNKYPVQANVPGKNSIK